MAVAVEGLDAAVLARRFIEVRAHTESLAARLSPEDQCIQSMPDVSPTKWHRAHTTWFFETFVLGALAGYRPYDPAFGYLFNSYYEAAGPRHPRPQRGLLSRPSAAEVAEYRRHVDEAVGAALAAGRIDPAGLALLELGLHHEQQHQELLVMDIKHVLAQNPLGAAYAAQDPFPIPKVPGPQRWQSHPGGLVDVGHDGGGFAFDNESPRHRVYLEPFEVSTELVTCGEWLTFMTDGGYDQPAWWLSDGWAAVQSNGWHAPLYWRCGEDGWEVFTLAGWKPLDVDEPVAHVSYYEADAFARWAGARLATEAEWEVAAGADPAGDTTFTGRLWQWSASAYLPYPGFAPAPGAVGEYNGKFMVNQHVLRGGATITPAGHLRLTYRNFFPPASRWPYTGVRLAR